MANEMTEVSLSSHWPLGGLREILISPKKVRGCGKSPFSSYLWVCSGEDARGRAQARAGFEGVWSVQSL